MATLMTVEPHPIETHSQVRLQATRYLASHPLRLNSTPFTTPTRTDDAFWSLLERLMASAQQPRGDQYGHYGHGYRRDNGNKLQTRSPHTRTSPIILLHTLSTQLTHRQTSLSQATHYKNLLRLSLSMPDCEDFDVAYWLDANMHGPVNFAPYSCIVKERALERVRGFIEVAELFDGGREEQKAGLYLCVVLLALLEGMGKNKWEDAYKGFVIEGVVKDLAKWRGEVKGGNVHLGATSVEYRGPQVE